MARKSLFDKPMTPKERAMRSAANLKKAGGEVVGLRLEPADIQSLNQLIALGHGKNKSDAVRAAVRFAAQYLNSVPQYEVGHE